MLKSRIAIVLDRTDPRGTGAASHMILNSLESFNSEQFEYFFLTSVLGKISEKLTSSKFCVKYIKSSISEVSNPIQFAISVFKAIYWFKLSRIKLVHFYSDHYRDPFFIAAKILNLKKVIHIHGYSQDPKNAWLQSADCFIFNSNLTKKNPRFQEISEHRKRVIHYGINPKNYFFDPSFANGSKLVIGNVSAIHPAKCLEDFIKIAKLVNEECSVEFWIVGIVQSEEYFLKLKSLVKELKLEQIIRFTGEQEDLKQIYNCLDLLIHTAEWEPFGIIYLEAALARVPVIGNYPGGIVDIATDGQELLLYQFGDVEQAANLALKLMADSRSLKKLTDNFYKKVVNENSAEGFQKKLESLYLELLGE